MHNETVVSNYIANHVAIPSYNVTICKIIDTFQILTSSNLLILAYKYLQFQQILSRDPLKKGGNGSEGQGKETIKWNGGRIGFGSERWESRREAQTERGSKNSKWKRIEEMVGGETCNNFDPPVLKTWRRACCPKEMLLLRRVTSATNPIHFISEFKLLITNKLFTLRLHCTYMMA